MTPAPLYLREAAATLETLARCRAESAEDRRALLARAAQYRAEAERLTTAIAAREVMLMDDNTPRIIPHQMPSTVVIPGMCTRPGPV